MASISRIAAFFVLSVLPAPVLAQVGHDDVEVVPPPEMMHALDLTALEQIALERNPTLIQAGAQIRISQGKSLQAGLFPNPSVGYAAEQIGSEGTAGEFHGFFVEQQIITGGKLQLSRAKFAQEAQQGFCDAAIFAWMLLTCAGSTRFAKLGTHVCGAAA